MPTPTSAVRQDAADPGHTDPTFSHSVLVPTQFRDKTLQPSGDLCKAPNTVTCESQRMSFDEERSFAPAQKLIPHTQRPTPKDAVPLCIELRSNPPKTTQTEVLLSDVERSPATSPRTPAAAGDGGTGAADAGCNAVGGSDQAGVGAGRVSVRGWVFPASHPMAAWVQPVSYPWFGGRAL